MNSGYVIFCGKTAFAQCLNRRIYTCAGEEAKDIKPIRQGSVLFIYNTDTKNLVGPFTAASEGAARIETGAWTSKIDEHSASANVRLEWEDLHIIENADQRFPFLNEPRKCELSTLQTQTLLNELKEARLFKG